MIHPKRYLLLACLGVGMPVLCGLHSAAFAQNETPELPLIVDGKMPLYPIMARSARIEGIVKIRVTTDGEKVSSLEMESGPPMLANFAKESIETWEFVKHKPTTFVTTFEYMIEGPAQCMYSNSAVVLNLPLEVHIRAKGLKTCDPAAKNNLHP